MRIVVSSYNTAYADAFRALHRACLKHYGITPATREQEDRVLSLLEAERHMACHLAFIDSEAVGFATWGLNFPAGPGVSLVMKELFVAVHGRGKGVGAALLAALVDVASGEGCERIDWGTDGVNVAAQAFYATIGAPVKEKVNFSVPHEEFSALKTCLRRRL